MEALNDINNIAECILELVSNSLNASATSIAIRVHRGERKIQVIDNGKGISRLQLKLMAEYNKKHFDSSKLQNPRSKTSLIKIRRLSNALMITSRHYKSPTTYLKVFEAFQSPKFFEIERRPCQGTSVIICGFHELSLKKWDTFSVCFLIRNIAIANPQVSFTIKDNETMDITMAITKLRSPTVIFKTLYSRELQHHKIWYIKSTNRSDIKFHAYIGLTNSTSIQYIFLNNKLVSCPLILQVISAVFTNSLKFIGKEQNLEISLRRRRIFILLFIMCEAEYVFTIDENQKRILIFRNIQNFLHRIKNKIVRVFIKGAAPLSVSHSAKEHNSSDALLTVDPIPFITPISIKNATFLPTHNSHHIKEHNEEYKTNEISSIANLTQLIAPIVHDENVNKEDTLLSLSNWSNWSSVKNLNNKTNGFKFYKQFDFLPRNLHKLLRGNKKLVMTDLLNEYNESLMKLRTKWEIPPLLPRQEIDIRPCKYIQKYREFTLKKENLKYVKIIGQMNKELIVGLTIKSDMKMLLLMDQHAIHERIRYEQLLQEYKSQLKNELLSIKLKEPIVIQLPVHSSTLLLSNRSVLNKFGIKFSMTSSKHSIIIHTVPELLERNKYHSDVLKLKSKTQNLLNELLENIASYKCPQLNSLPLTIQDAIASEACHGSIKFGAPLTLRKSKWLLKLLSGTKNPTQCAHGRPSIIPLLDLIDLETRRKKTVPVCNNI
ncbi:DNA mismatch repair protein Mlh3-like [Ceratina calcarata]|uniref:DNA mismatch repair protein Mlh3-like n=1 Tax=Ceratina calcarata TaxID=156304 RepID=A0AAJ7JFY1_9HYME|nr:DNA mismatch repair protein Mlh3-like [Ceratina calcarata]